MSYHPFLVPVTDKLSVLRAPDYYAVPDTFELPEDFNPYTDELPEAPEDAVELDVDFDEAMRQLALMICHDFSTAGKVDDERREVEIGSNHRYIVATDSEADDLWDEDLDNFINECVLSELPERYRDFFDRERFKEYCRSDGRAHTLARYDGHENYVDLIEWGPNSTKHSVTYFIYRT